MIIHPHPNPLINGKEAITLTSILSPQGEEDQGSDFSEAPPVKT